MVFLKECVLGYSSQFLMNGVSEKNAVHSAMVFKSVKQRKEKSLNKKRF